MRYEKGDCYEHILVSSWKSNTVGYCACFGRFRAYVYARKATLTGAFIFANFLGGKFLKNIPVKQAAYLMGVSQQFIRIGLQTGRLPFGTAVKMSSRWTYYINEEKFFAYITACNMKGSE